MAAVSAEALLASDHEHGSSSAPVRSETRNPLLDLVLMLVAVAVAIAVFANSLQGEFVYDDERQIVKNTLIQDPPFFWKAIFSDVWAFKGSAEGPVSNYWRPTFILWLILNHRLFGLESTVGWHAGNILMHAGVVALAYLLLRQLAVAPPIAGAALLLFAVHPVHVESVAWVSGSPDLLMALALLGALAFVLAAGDRPAPALWGAALLLYAVAQLAKEVAIFFPLLVLGIELGRRNREAGDAAEASGREARRRRRAFLRAAPFALVAVAYLGGRLLVLEQGSQRVSSGLGFLDIVVTAPSVLAFYLRQVAFPVRLGPSYPLRAVDPGALGLGNFVLPLAAVLAAAAALVWLARRHRAGRLGLALFLLFLLPAMNLSAFHPEQLVHDRYLYLPLLGFLLAVLPALPGLAQGLTRLAPARASWTVLAAAAISSFPLAAQTTSYNTAWASDLALWTWGIRIDPTSSFNFLQYGVSLHEAGRHAEARRAFDRSLALAPSANAYLGRAEVSIDERRFADAEGDLLQVLERFPDNAQAYERLALSYDRQGRLDEAERTLRLARQEIPYLTSTLTEMLAVVLYRGGRKEEALRELESVHGKIHQEYGPRPRLVLFRLGMLYLELGRSDEARAALEEYLAATRTIEDPETRAVRRKAAAELERLAGRE